MNLNKKKQIVAFPLTASTTFKRHTFVTSQFNHSKVKQIPRPMKTCPHSFPKTCILPQHNDILYCLPALKSCSWSVYAEGALTVRKYWRHSSPFIGGTHWMVNGTYSSITFGCYMKLEQKPNQTSQPKAKPGLWSMFIYLTMRGGYRWSGRCIKISQSL